MRMGLYLGRATTEMESVSMYHSASGRAYTQDYYYYDNSLKGGPPSPQETSQSQPMSKRASECV